MLPARPAQIENPHRLARAWQGIRAAVFPPRPRLGGEGSKRFRPPARFVAPAGPPAPHQTRNTRDATPGIRRPADLDALSGFSETLSGMDNWTARQREVR